MPKSESNLAAALKYIDRDGRRGVRQWRAPTGNEIRRIRESVGLSQAKFAARYGLSVVSLRKWEQGRATPEQAASMVLRMIEVNPDTVGSIIDKARKKQKVSAP